MTQAFLDANIPVYAGGRDHPYHEPCREILRLAADAPASFVTNAEVLQELLHRYVSLRVWEPGGRETFVSFVALMHDRIEPVRASDVEDAARLASEHSRLSARDLVHLAVMRRLGITQIVTADTAFDNLPGIERLDPLRLDSWRERVVEP
jgi:predicted nucleic acid-binding protein